MREAEHNNSSRELRLAPQYKKSVSAKSSTTMDDDYDDDNSIATTTTTQRKSEKRKERETLTDNLKTPLLFELAYQLNTISDSQFELCPFIQSLGAEEVVLLILL